MTQNQGSIFDHSQAEGRHGAVPWSQTFEMCFRNLRNRQGRYALIFISLAVVVAFFVNNLSYHSIIVELRTSEDVHTMAVLQRAGVQATDPAAERKQRDQMIWLLTLSGALCFVGVVNTMYMSVTERYQEIGTLKCLGALDSFVVRLFMVESVLIGLVGSTIGGFLGFLLTLGQVGMTLEFGILSGGTVLWALAIGLVTALLGGTFLTVLASLYPTYAAAKMKPVDAMRTEI